MARLACGGGLRGHGAQRWVTLAPIVTGFPIRSFTVDSLGGMAQRLERQTNSAMPFMKLCSKCGSKNETSLGQMYCFRCGAELPEQSISSPSTPSPLPEEKPTKSEFIGLILIGILIIAVVLYIMGLTLLFGFGFAQDHAF